MITQRLPLRERMNDWTRFETKLFNLITAEGDTNLIFSKRITATQRMLDALDEVTEGA